MPIKPPHTTMYGATAVTTSRGCWHRRSQRAADDAALIASVKRGDPGSREALYHRYKRRVYGLALRIVGPSDAEEVAQEAFIRIFRGLPKFRGDAALSTWIYRLAVNAALSHRTPPRQRAPADRRQPGGGRRHRDAAAPPSPPAATRSCAPASNARWPSCRRATARWWSCTTSRGWSTKRSPSILNCHVGTSKSQLHKARARLRAILAGGRHHGLGARKRLNPPT